MKSSVYALECVVRPWNVLVFAMGLTAVVVTGCSEEGVTSEESLSVPDVVEDSEIQEEDVVEEEEVTPDPLAECQEDKDCDDDNACRSEGVCQEGSCLYQQQSAGTSCGSFCAPGVCTEKGNCELQAPFDCPDLDGNLCTLPTCDADLDECVETALPNGSPPYASTECYENPVCLDGVPDYSQADLTEQGQGCEQMNANLDPQGCIERYECVGGDVGCEPIFLPNKTQCWAEGGQNGETCTGHSCQDGQCVVDSTFSHTCDFEALADSCGEACQACTTLECDWIDDPGNPGGTSRIPYCKPTAIANEPCDASSSCALEQTCVIDVLTNTDQGKESLGLCTGGTEKTPEECADELGLNPLACVLAGLECANDGSGCTYNEEKANTFCSPPDGLCFEPNNTICSHVELEGGNWDAETGCNVAWVDINCDDSNDCTVDACFKDDSGWACSHDPVAEAACGDDGDPCTTEGLCVDGECTGQVVLCEGQDDGNPCTQPACDEGDCTFEPVTSGTPCEDNNPCTLASECSENGLCSSDIELPCDDGNPCTLDGCEASSGCFNVAQPGDCDDGDDCTVDDFCEGGSCTGGTAVSCDDGDVCTSDNCEAGLCQSVPAVDGGACDDGNTCTGNDTCAGGTCIGLPGAVNCGDDNICTNDICLVNGDCVHEPIPDGFPCGDQDASECQNGECVCIPQCDGTICDNSDGCGSTCGCGAGETCAAGKCVIGGGEDDDDVDGTYAVSGNNGMVGTTMTLDFDADSATVTGYGVISVINVTVDYTGTYNYPAFTLEGSYLYSLLGIFTVQHDETWTLSFSPNTGGAIQFTGLLEDTGESNDFNVVGTKTN